MRNTATFIASATCIFLLACASPKVQTQSSQASTTTQSQSTGEWITLFDGKTTTGWHSYNKPTVDANWKVVDGALTMDPSVKGGGDIVTDGSYENYEFVTEWRISEGGNSGIIFDVKEDTANGATYQTGAEMQVLDNVKAEDNKKENHLAGLLYDMTGTAALSKPKPVGEWNEARIIQDKGHLTFFFNGVKTLDVQIGGAEWNTMLANSKFKNWKGFMTAPSGKIAFQDHGHDVAFRNIKIRTL